MTEFMRFLSFFGALYGLTIGGFTLYVHYAWDIEIKLLWLAYVCLAVGLYSLYYMVKWAKAD